MNLFNAARSGNLKVVREFLAIDAEIKTTVKSNPDILLGSCANGHSEVVKEFLMYGVDPNVCNKFGITPLNYASRTGRLEIVRELILNGADVNAIDKFGYSSLSKTCGRGHLLVIKELLLNNTDPNLKHGEGKGPLEVASKHNKTDVIELIKNFFPPLHSLSKKSINNNKVNISILPRIMLE